MYPAPSRLLLPLVLVGIFVATNSGCGKPDPAKAPPDPRKLIALSGSQWEFLGATESQTLPEPNTLDFTSASWTRLSVPHTFQTRTDMHLEQGLYRRSFAVPDSIAHAHLYLIFEGAAAIADVYVNGHHLGQHRGAFTRFIFDATEALHRGDNNELVVAVDNRIKSIRDCLPNDKESNSLYTVWGGLYRHVWLLATTDLQIDPTFHASPGIFISPSANSDHSAQVAVAVMLRNTALASKSAQVTATILDPKGKFVESLTGSARVAGKDRATVNLSGTVFEPLLWTPEAPNLYHVRVDVADEDGQVTDSLTQPMGFHNVAWDFKAGTLKVNGKPLVLYGASLYQETEKNDFAVEPEDLIANFDGLQDLGVNFVRLIHYPRAQLEYDLCDQRGIFCWTANGHSHRDIVSPTADLITREMVAQNYNHPSLMIWSVGNEGSVPVAEAEALVVKAIDPVRPVMVAGMKQCANVDYLATISYPGWMTGDRWKFEPSGMICEIGAGGVVTTHCDYLKPKHKVNAYEPEEYQQLVAEAEFQIAFHKPGTLGMYNWCNFRDSNDHKYKSEESPLHHGLNTKGLLTYGGDKKDIYYLYRCFLRPNEPTLHITSKRYFLRQGTVDNGIKVYSNAPSVTLKLNGQTISTLNNGEYLQKGGGGKTETNEVDNVFYWPVPLHTGKNFVTVTDDRGQSDSATIYFYGHSGLPELPTPSPLLAELTSSNPDNPAYYMDMPVEAQWPVYYDLDSTADNSLDLIPASVKGANWLALRRVTKAGQATDVSFVLTRPATVSILCTKQDPKHESSIPPGYNEVNAEPVSWRDNDLILVPAQLYARHCAAGERVSVSMGDRDAIILLKAD